MGKVIGRDYLTRIVKIAFISGILWLTLSSVLHATDATPDCGDDGELACWVQKATHVKSVACQPGEFYDLSTNACWSCEGYNRTIFPIKDLKACEQPSREETRKAKFISSINCDSNRGEFYDPIRGGQCYKCPPGYNRTVFHVDSNEACTKGLFGPYAKARHVKASHCTGDAFKDPRNGGECWSCEGWSRTLAPVTADNACSHAIKAKYRKAEYKRALSCDEGTFFDPIRGGECFRCPEGYNRTLSHVEADDACMPRNMCDEGLSPYTVRPEQDGQRLLSDAYSKCGKIGECGKQGQRPCYLTERIPSCDTGLREDFNKNQCVQLRPGEDPFLAGLESLTSEISTLKEDCKRGIYNLPVLKDSMDNLLQEQRGTVQASDPNNQQALQSLNDMINFNEDVSNCQSQATAGFSCAAIGILELVQLPTQAANAVSTAWNNEPCTSPWQLSYAKATRSTQRPRNIDLFANCDQSKREFWDPIDSGSCWSCPEGYDRHLTHVQGDDACIRSDGFPQIFRGLCATTHGLIAPAGESLACMTKIITEGEVASLFQGGDSQDWNGICTMAGELAFETVLGVATGGASAAASGTRAVATGGSKFVQFFRKVGRFLARRITAAPTNVTRLSRANQARTQLSRLRTIVNTSSECRAMNQRNQLLQAFDDGIEESGLNAQLDGSSASSAPATAAATASSTPRTAAMTSSAAASTQASVFSLNGSWVQLPGNASDIGAGEQIVVANRNGDFYSEVNGQWQQLPSRAKGKRLDVGKRNTVLMVAGNGIPWRHDGSTWKKLPGKAIDIGVGGDNVIWALGGNKGRHGYSIFRLDGARWTQVPGEAMRIDVDKDGLPWVVNKGGDVFKYNGSSWDSQKKAPRASDVAVAENGNVFIVSDKQIPYHLTRDKWKKMPGKAVNISADKQGNPWVINSAGDIFRWQPR